MDYKTATPDLTAAEGVDLILDAATCAVPDGPHNTLEYRAGWYDGVCLALGSLLSFDERPSREILDEAIADM